jgi:hypothetical protein
MSRWHHATCKTPQVFVNENLPLCEACGASPNLAELSAQNLETSRPWSVPPDEPFGKLNLYWPSMVPYRRDGNASRSSDLDDNDEIAPGRKELDHSDSPPSADDKQNHDHAATSWVYTKTLSPKDIRLLRLSPNTSGDDFYPIHVDLHTFSDSACPEYDATSYVVSLHLFPNMLS